MGPGILSWRPQRDPNFFEPGTDVAPMGTDADGTDELAADPSHGFAMAPVGAIIASDDDRLVPLGKWTQAISFRS